MRDAATRAMATAAGISSFRNLIPSEAAIRLDSWPTTKSGGFSHRISSKCCTQGAEPSALCKKTWRLPASTLARTGSEIPKRSAAKRLTPTAGMPRDIDNPRAAATEILVPVKLPGPVPVPIAAKSFQSIPVSFKSASISGKSLSSCPRPIFSLREATVRLPRMIAAVQNSEDVSKPRTRGSSGGNRPNLDDFGNVMP